VEDVEDVDRPAFESFEKSDRGFRLSDPGSGGSSPSTEERREGFLEELVEVGRELGER